LIQKSMLALAICLAVSAPEVFAASAYEDASSVAADMAAAAPVQNVQNTQKVQAVSQSKPQKQKKLKESDIIKQVEAATPRPEASAMAAKDYLLRAGDQLNIVVTQQQDLGNSSANQTPFTVRPDGNVSFPLVGEIHAEGMTVSEFTNVLTYGLSRYIVDPDVAVNITKLGARASTSSAKSRNRVPSSSRSPTPSLTPSARPKASRATRPRKRFTSSIRTSRSRSSKSTSTTCCARATCPRTTSCAKATFST
jgi:hypothetical protein